MMKKTNRAGWIKYIDIMIKKGTQLNSEERSLLIDYLSTGKINEVCMKRYLALILSLCLITSFFLIGCGSSEETNFNVDPTSEGQRLLNERCTSCHDLNKVYNKKTDRAGWEKIVNDMVKKGAKLNSSEKTILIDYLLSR